MDRKIDRGSETEPKYQLPTTTRPFGKVDFPTKETTHMVDEKGSRVLFVQGTGPELQPKTFKGRSLLGDKTAKAEAPNGVVHTIGQCIHFRLVRW